MARVFFVTGSKGGVGKSVGAIALLDYFEMRNRKVSLVETDTANPDVGKAYQKDVKLFSLVNLDENEGWLDLLDIVDASKDDEVVVNTAARNNDGVNRYGSKMCIRDRVIQVSLEIAAGFEPTVGMPVSGKDFELCAFGVEVEEDWSLSQDGSGWIDKELAGLKQVVEIGG